MDKIYSDIKKNENLRQCVSQLKEYAKEDSFQLDPSILKILMNSDDWKVRKNTCALLAGKKEYTDYLFNEYSKESNYIVKKEMIDTLVTYPVSLTKDRLNMILQSLLKISDEGNDRHIQEMISAIVTRLSKDNLMNKPVFNGLNRSTNVVLTCLKCNQDLLFDRVVEPKKKVGLGVMLKIEDISQVAKYREYEDLLFLLTNFKNVPCDYMSIADAVEKSNLLELLDRMHMADYYLFRVDTSYMPQTILKNDFVKKLSMAIQSKSHHRLFNSSSSYSVELQLRPMKNDCVRIFLKLYTYEDPRFRYRVESTSNSMQPYLAASIVQLVKPYLIDSADVLDLCCGTGTLLIERAFEKKPHFIIGNDIFGEAIEKARKNTKILNMDIHYVNRDYGDFTHPHLFDEIISDLPISSTKITYDMLQSSYMQFMKTAAKLLKSGGYLFVYTTESKTLRKVLRFNEDAFHIENEHHIQLKNTEAILFVVKRI